MANLYKFGEIELTPVVIDGSPHFPAKQVCQILGISKYRDAVRKLDEDERVYAKVDTPGGKQTVTCVNESGLYHLIFRSRHPAAKKFRRWVTGEVIPSIREKGFYAAEDLLKKLRERQGYLLNLQERAAHVLFGDAMGTNDE